MTLGKTPHIRLFIDKDGQLYVLDQSSKEKQLISMRVNSDGTKTSRDIASDVELKMWDFRWEHQKESKPKTPVKKPESLKAIAAKAANAKPVKKLEAKKAAPKPEKKPEPVKKLEAPVMAPLAKKPEPAKKAVSKKPLAKTTEPAAQKEAPVQKVESATSSESGRPKITRPASARLSRTVGML